MKIRTYGRTELAQMYNPDFVQQAAWRKLKKWMMKHPALRTLADKRERSFTPSEVQKIVDELGEP